MDYLDNDKAARINPMFKPGGNIPSCGSVGKQMPFEVRSREQEKALIRAYDYGIEALNEEGVELVQFAINDIVLAMRG